MDHLSEPDAERLSKKLSRKRHPHALAWVSGAPNRNWSPPRYGKNRQQSHRLPHDGLVYDLAELDKI